MYGDNLDDGEDEVFFQHDGEEENNGLEEHENWDE